jgi:hypothetical protein
VYVVRSLSVVPQHCYDCWLAQLWEFKSGEMYIFLNRFMRHVFLFGKLLPGSNKITVENEKKKFPQTTTTTIKEYM